jgi:hypothetical protein
MRASEPSVGSSSSLKPKPFSLMSPPFILPFLFLQPRHHQGRSVRSGKRPPTSVQRNLKLTPSQVRYSYQPLFHLLAYHMDLGLQVSHQRTTLAKASLHTNRWWRPLKSGFLRFTLSNSAVCAVAPPYFALALQINSLFVLSFVTSCRRLPRAALPLLQLLRSQIRASFRPCKFVVCEVGRIIVLHSKIKVAAQNIEGAAVPLCTLSVWRFVQVLLLVSFGLLFFFLLLLLSPFLFKLCPPNRRFIVYQRM